MSWQAVALALAALALVANALVVAALAGFLLSRVSAGAREAWEGTRDVLAPYALPGAFVVAAVATLGSLYFQFGAGFDPCDLCWFQRICMYPESLLLAVATARRDLTSARWYVLPLAAVGSLISAYHWQLQRIPAEAHPSCGVGQPVCSHAPFFDFGFISIPYMAGSAFLLVIALLLMARHEEEEWDEAEDGDGLATGGAENEPSRGAGPPPRPALSR